MKKIDISNLTNKAVKICLSGAFIVSSAFTLTGCGSKEKESTDEVVEEEIVEEEVVEEVVEEKPVVEMKEFEYVEDDRGIELTPLQQEISELEDFQYTDKIYSNEDLEPFNKIQGYLYDYKDSYHGEGQIIELWPPEEVEQHDAKYDSYTLISPIVAPTYFWYKYEGILSNNYWEKVYINKIDGKLVNWLGEFTSDVVEIGRENIFIRDGELDQLFDGDWKNKGKPIQLPSHYKERLKDYCCCTENESKTK